MQCVYHLNQGVVTDLMGNRVENYVGFSDLYFFREGDDYVTDIFGNRRELGFGHWLKHATSTVGKGISKTAKSVKEGVVDTGKKIGETAKTTVKSGKEFGKGVSELAKSKGKKGWGDLGKGTLGTVFSPLAVAGDVAGGVVDTGVRGGLTVTGEALKATGIKGVGKVGKALESDTARRITDLGVNTALAFTPVGAAAEVAEATEGVTAVEETAQAVRGAEEALKVAKETKNVEEIATAEKELQEAQAAEKELQEAQAAEKEAQEVQAAEKEAQEAQEAEKGTKDATKQSRLKTIRNKLVKAGFQGAALDSAIAIAEKDLGMFGSGSGSGSGSDPADVIVQGTKKGNPPWVYGVVVLVIIFLGIIVYNFLLK